MNPTSVVTVEQTATITAVLNQVFQAVLDFLFTMVKILLDFFTQPEVLGALAVIAVMFMAYRKLRAKSLT